MTLAGLPVRASQAVLCLAPNGHLTIEAGQNVCVQYAPTVNDAVEPAASQIGSDCCGECVDIPIAGSALRLRGRGYALSTALEMAPPIPTVVAAIQSPAALNEAPLAPERDSRSSFAPSRKTILRN